MSEAASEALTNSLDDMLATLASDALDPVFYPPELLGRASAWWSHVPFAFWLMAACRPRVLVELGTHNGVSYAAFCEANARERIGAQCFAIDTWRGDEHAGFYDESVFWTLSEFNERRYRGFSTLIRARFHDALDRFADGSIDLLHIDGRHRYEDVKEDYEDWLPKLSDRSVVIFHDTNVHDGDFGVYRFFRELSKDCPSFEFLHGFGLGIIALGPNAPSAVVALCGLENASLRGRLTDRFAQLGSHWMVMTREALSVQAHATREAESAQAHAAREAKTRALFDRSLRRIIDMRHTIERLACKAQELEKALEKTRQWAVTRYAAAVEAGAQAAKVNETDDGADHLRRSIYFDPDWYMSTNPDVAKAGLDPVLHYLEHGAAEGREPGPVFSGREYLAINPDVAAANLNPLLHYVLYGHVEGRKLTRPEAPVSSNIRRLVRRANRGASLLYISGEPDTPGHRYRVLRYIDAAKANGIEATFVRHDMLKDQLSTLKDHDTLIIWRVPWDEALQRAIDEVKAAGGKIVFDVDDLMVDPNLARLDLIDGIRSQSLTESGTRAHYERVRRTMLAADFCIATTQELAFHMRLAGKTAFVLPNGFDQATHDRSRSAARAWQGNKDGLVRMGYAGGSRTHQRDLGLAIEAIATVLHENPKCRLVLFQTSDGHRLIDVEEYPALQSVLDRIEWRLLQPLEKLPEEIARFDINLAPLEFGNPFCEAKSELKFFEAALVDVPTIASPTGPFRRAVEHGRTGLLAASADDWLASLRLLIADPQLRKSMAHAAYIATLAKFGPRQRALQMGRVLEQLHRGPRAARGFALDAYLTALPWTPPAVFPSDLVFEQDKGGRADVTVIVPLYNYEETVVEALDSVAGQTLKSLDLVIIDGCSTDASLAVAKTWAEQNAARFNRIAVLRNQDNYGLAFCRNSGFDAAVTPYVLPLDADNRLLPTCAAELLESIASSSVAYVYPTLERFGFAAGQVSCLPFDAQRFVGNNYIDALALVSKEAWAIVGGYKHIRHGWEDYDFWSRLAEVGLSGEWLPKTLAEYRVHERSITKQMTTVRQSYLDLVAEFEARHPWVSMVDRQNLRRPSPPIRELTTHPGRLDALIPILRCPVTRQKLTYSEDRSELVTVDGVQRWTIVEGRAAMIAGLATPEIKPVEQISNEVPEAALSIIKETKGLVLNLSAGGSLEKFDHVVEVEFAIFRHTDVLADAHYLPFDDACFDAVIAMNAFEHYRDPLLVAAELMRVLKPGGRIHIRTAFLQPLHEKPWHFYNCTRYGMAEWFKAFERERLDVSTNFCPNHSIAWLASECEAALRADVSSDAADAFASASMRDIIELWRDPTMRRSGLWTDFEKISQDRQEITAAGFELIGKKPDHRRAGARLFETPPETV